MANEVRVKVAVETGEAQKDLKQLNQKMSDTKGTVGGLNAGFGQLSKKLAVLGIGTLGVSAVLGGTIKIIQSVAKETAQLDFVFQLLPDNLARAFADMKPRFGELSVIFKRTEEDIGLAFAILLRDTRRADITFEQLAGTLGFVTREQMDVGAAAELVAAALNGDISAIKTVTGFYKSLNEALLISAITGEEAVTIFDAMSNTFRQNTRDLARALDDLSKGNFGALLDIMQIVSDFGGVMFVPGMRGLGDMVGRIKDMGGEWDDLVALIEGAGSAVGGILDGITDAFSDPDAAAKGFGLTIGEVGELTDANQGFRDYLASLTDDFGVALTAAQLLREELATPFPTGSGQQTGIPPGPASSSGRTFFQEGGGIRIPPGPASSSGRTAFQTAAFESPRSAGGFLDDALFDHGGIVGGAPGTHQRIIAKAGERVLTENQQMGLGSVTNNFIVEGDLVVDTEARMDTLVRKIQDKLTQLDRGGQGI